MSTQITHMNHCLSFIDIQVESWTIDLRLAEANASQPASGLDSGFSDTQCFLAASVFRTAWTGCTAFSLLEALRGRRCGFVDD